MTELITIGTVVTMVASTVYALPAHLCNFTVITSGGTVAVSLDGSTWQTITLDANKNFMSSAPFVRVTGASALIVAKPY
jgi:hypothetical protein